MLCLILALRISINIVYENELCVYLRVLFIKYRLFPERKKKFDLKKYEKKQKKKQSKPKIVLKESLPDEPEKPTLTERITQITDILSVFFKTFLKYLHVKMAKIHIKVGTPDAAQTAILYGAVSGAAACLLALIDEITNLNSLKSSSVLIEPDFLSDKCEAKINISLSLSVFGALVTLIRSLWRYMILKNKNRK